MLIFEAACLLTTTHLLSPLEYLVNSAGRLEFVQLCLEDNIDRVKFAWNIATKRDGLTLFVNLARLFDFTKDVKTSKQ